MHWDSERHKQFGRRAVVLAGGKMILFSVLAGRMFYLQVLEAERYRMMAEENRINLRLLAPPRGRIVDRFGVALADNRQIYRVLLIREDIPGGDVAATLDVLARLIPIGAGERTRIIRDSRRNRGFVPVTVRENLSWKQVARIEVNAPDLPGILVEVGESRHYPHGRASAHVLGYVAAVAESDMTGDPLLELPSFRIGKAGVEKVHDLALRGSSGSSQVEVNAFGRVIRELERREGEPGAEVRITVDLELQKLLARRFGGESGAAVVMDVHTGDILAMASKPSFDPNAFNEGLSAAEWQVVVSNERAPLINKTVAGQYPPGSTFKMVVALAALERGVVTQATQVFCPGYLKLGDVKFHCWRKGGHGLMDLHEGLSQSCDVYFYELARRTGIERIAAMARRLGFGSRLGLDLPGEQPGLVPTPDWKTAVIGDAWHQGETLLTGIGQAYLLATPLQMTVMMARLVNGGRAIVPRVTRAVGGVPFGDGVESVGLGLDAGHLTAVRRALVAAVNDPLGTAYRARIEESGREMGGKTGTVQVRRITKAEREQGIRKNEELPWKQRDHALFIGFAPVAAPRYAVSLLVEHGGVGATVAAPIVRDVLLAAQRRGERPAAGLSEAVRPSAPTAGRGRT